MDHVSPSIQGFRISFSRPFIALAEIAWRWALGAAGIALLILGLLEYLDTLPVNEGDLLFLRSRQPFLITQAVLHILRGSATRFVTAFIILALCFTVAWIVVGSIGRAATLQWIFDEVGNQNAPRDEGAKLQLRNRARMHFASLMGLNFLRAAVALAALMGVVAALFLITQVKQSIVIGGGLSLLLGVWILVWLTWAFLNWFLTLAAVFVVGEGADTFSAVAASVDLFGKRPGALFSAGTWFGLAHFGVFCLASSMVSFPLALAPVVPLWVVIAGVALVALLYFALVDFINIARLATFVVIAESPEPPPAPAVIVPAEPEPPAPSPPPQLDSGLLGIGD